jgi:hypothetical protein
MAAVPANCNSTSGPSSVYFGGAEADTIGDDDGAAYEGGRIVAETTYTGAYTADAYVAPGTQTGATILITSDGTGSKTCTFTGLDDLLTATSSGGTIRCIGGAACTGSNSYPGSFARLICTTTIGGVPTATTADLLVGDAAADTGTIIASAGEAWRQAYSGRACPTAGTAATCNADSLAYPLAGSGLVNAGGSLLTPFMVTVSYTPELPNGTADAVLWSFKDDGTATDIWYARIVSSTGRLYLYAQSAEEGAERVIAYQTTGTTWAPGTTYKIRYRIAPSVAAGVAIWINDTPVALTTGTTIANPPNSLDNLHLGAWGTTSLHAKGKLKLMGVSK